MITIRHAASLGTAHDGGQDLRCHFAFADYADPAHGHEGRLRAVNTGTLPAGGTYRIGPEAAVDIVTWVVKGALATDMEGFAPDALGAGGLHLASTGSGCAQLAWRAGGQGAGFIQFWFLSDTQGTTPAQEMRPALPELEDGGFRIFASGFPEDDPEEAQRVSDGAPVTLSARARLLHAAIPAGEGAAYGTAPGRVLYLLVVSGAARIDTVALHAGDAAAISGQTDITVMADEAAVVLLADVAV
ncbi:pirin family protein [Komagataeibacter melomenusus]